MVKKGPKTLDGKVRSELTGDGRKNPFKDAGKLLENAGWIDKKKKK